MKKALIWIFCIIIFVGIVKLTLLSQVWECQRIQNETTAKLQDLAACNTHEDCVVTAFTCPFGCSTALNNTKMGEALSAISIYNKQCMMVCPDCPKSINIKAVCERGFCKADV